MKEWWGINPEIIQKYKDIVIKNSTDPLRIFGQLHRVLQNEEANLSSSPNPTLDTKSAQNIIQKTLPTLMKLDPPGIELYNDALNTQQASWQDNEDAVQSALINAKANFAALQIFAPTHISETLANFSGFNQDIVQTFLDSQTNLSNMTPSPDPIVKSDEDIPTIVVKDKLPSKIRIKPLPDARFKKDNPIIIAGHDFDKNELTINVPLSQPVSKKLHVISSIDEDLVAYDQDKNDPLFYVPPPEIKVKDPKALKADLDELIDEYIKLRLPLINDKPDPFFMIKAVQDSTKGLSIDYHNEPHAVYDEDTVDVSHLHPYFKYILIPTAREKLNASNLYQPLKTTAEKDKNDLINKLNSLITFKKFPFLLEHLKELKRKEIEFDVIDSMVKYWSPRGYPFVIFYTPEERLPTSPIVLKRVQYSFGLLLENENYFPELLQKNIEESNPEFFNYLFEETKDDLSLDMDLKNYFEIKNWLFKYKDGFPRESLMELNQKIKNPLLKAVAYETAFKLRPKPNERINLLLPKMKALERISFGFDTVGLLKTEEFLINKAKSTTKEHLEADNIIYNTFLKYMPPYIKLLNKLEVNSKEEQVDLSKFEVPNETDLPQQYTQKMISKYTPKIMTENLEKFRTMNSYLLNHPYTTDPKDIQKKLDENDLSILTLMAMKSNLPGGKGFFLNAKHDLILLRNQLLKDKLTIEGNGYAKFIQDKSEKRQKKNARHGWVETRTDEIIEDWLKNRKTHLRMHRIYPDHFGGKRGKIRIVPRTVYESIPEIKGSRKDAFKQAEMEWTAMPDVEKNAVIANYSSPNKSYQGYETLKKSYLDEFFNHYNSLNNLLYKAPFEDAVKARKFQENMYNIWFKRVSNHKFSILAQSKHFDEELEMVMGKLIGDKKAELSRIKSPQLVQNIEYIQNALNEFKAYKERNKWPKYAATDVNKSLIAVKQADVAEIRKREHERRLSIMARNQKEWELHEEGTVIWGRVETDNFDIAADIRRGGLMKFIQPIFGMVDTLTFNSMNILGELSGRNDTVRYQTLATMGKRYGYATGMAPVGREYSKRQVKNLDKMIRLEQIPSTLLSPFYGPQIKFINQTATLLNKITSGIRAVEIYATHYYLKPDQLKQKIEGTYTGPESDIQLEIGDIIPPYTSKHEVPADIRYLMKSYILDPPYKDSYLLQNLPQNDILSQHEMIATEGYNTIYKNMASQLMNISRLQQMNVDPFFRFEMQDVLSSFAVDIDSELPKSTVKELQASRSSELDLYLIQKWANVERKMSAQLHGMIIQFNGLLGKTTLQKIRTQGNINADKASAYFKMRRLYQRDIQPVYIQPPTTTFDIPTPKVNSMLANYNLLAQDNYNKALIPIKHNRDIEVLDTDSWRPDHSKRELKQFLALRAPLDEDEELISIPEETFQSFDEEAFGEENVGLTEFLPGGVIVQHRSPPTGYRRLNYKETSHYAKDFKEYIDKLPEEHRVIFVRDPHSDIYMPGAHQVIRGYPFIYENEEIIPLANETEFEAYKKNRAVMKAKKAYRREHPLTSSASFATNTFPGYSSPTVRSPINYEGIDSIPKSYSIRRHDKYIDVDANNYSGVNIGEGSWASNYDIYLNSEISSTLDEFYNRNRPDIYGVGNYPHFSTDADIIEEFLFGPQPHLNKFNTRKIV